MDTVEYVEQVVIATLAEARSTYDALHERVHKLVTLIAGGAGGTGVYVLGKVGAGDAWLQVWPLAALCCWWLGIAGVLLMRGATSLPLTAGSSAATLTESFNRHFSGQEGADAEAKALQLTRWSQLAAVDGQIKSFCAGADLRSSALDGAYKALVCSPVIAAFAVLLAIRLH